MSVHTGEEAYIYGFIIVSFINIPGSQELSPVKPVG